MEEHQESAPPEPAQVADAVEEISMKYVAFCDILGFSAKIATDFDETLKVYRQFGERLEPQLFGNVRMTMYSDAILLTSDELFPLLSAVQILWFIALTEDLMIRGGIAYGRYWERRQGDHMMVVSDALVRAVKIEGMVGVPAVVLADDINLDLGYWIPRFSHGQYRTPLLHFRDRNIVNPFSSFWGISARTRATMLMEQSPAHKEKYLWFLALYNAVAAGDKLVPDAAFTEMIDKGIIGPVSEGQTQPD
ncbi:hypothetical protein QZM78_08005 [Burkholderia multivorans]|uniref:hypothetical protein n=1 Tax=Burkholderia multivorans TaxID=87883 RepID=UPI001C23E002|nr:hypothetical protein [Burkholderia multivorans]MBU9365356.1 hypothetical protein [Burkholderia multivorans]MDN7743987.1 hypothetical protein [Burkholderia multivorans]MDN7953933.1 hypothetical protein [Burkholderia multivorans]